jgi:hypothetical protein
MNQQRGKLMCLASRDFYVPFVPHGPALPI